MDPSNTALFVIDVQQGLFKKSTPIYKAGDLLKNINTIIEHAHRNGVPVFYIQHSDMKTLRKGSQDWQLHPELNPLKTDYRIHKQHDNAFEETKLGDILQSKNITNLVITGLVTLPTH
ncbi:MAG: isochorismatase family protein [Anaerolineales bacterium]